jgi:hypothetical protein
MTDASMQDVLEEASVEMLGVSLKLVNAVPQRWSSMAKVLARMLRMWTVVDRMWYEKKRLPLPLDDYKPLLIQWYSIMRAVTDVTTK